MYQGRHGMFGLGLLAFALFFLSDYNDLLLHRRWLTVCFPAGGALLGAAVFFQLAPGRAPLSGALRWAVLVLGAGFALLLIYTLFFAFSAADAYASPGKRRRVCVTGVYAICRHPGVLWLLGLMLCLHAGGGLPLSAVAAYTALNILLVLFEDRLVFPRLLDGYEEYRRTTPFLLPTPRSMYRCFRQTNN
jgi:protein-S-isoprenylcysteine O-methyltransferase Ste14